MYIALRAALLALVTLAVLAAVARAGESPNPVPFPAPVVEPASGPITAGQNPDGTPRDRNLDDIIEGVKITSLDDGVILQSGDIKILSKTVEKVETSYVASEKRKFAKFQTTLELLTFLRKRFAFRFLANALIEKYVADNKLVFPREQFEEQYKKFQEAKALDAGSYEQWLLDNGIDDEEFKRFWAANWAIEQSMAQQVSDAEVDAMLQKMREEIPFRRASHILVMYKGSERADAGVKRTKEEALKEAEDAIKRIQGGEDFAKVAQEVSDCPSRKNGGDLNFFPRKGAMAEAFAEATYGLAKVGDTTTKPVETTFGYHVIKLTEVRMVNDVKKELRQHLSARRFSKLIQQMMEEAGAQAQFNEKYIVDLEKAQKARKDDPTQQARKALDSLDSSKK